MTVPPPAGKPFWITRKILAVILVIILVIGGAIAGLVVYYHPFQSAGSPGSPDFKISTTTPQDSSAGSMAQIQLGIIGINGFNFDASFALHPATGLTCQATSSSTVLTPNTSVDVNCTSNSSGVYLLNITVASGPLSHFKTVSFNFTPPGAVTVKGKITSNTDVASDIKFVQGTTSHVSPVSTNGNYTVILPNLESYMVTINDTIGGSCSGGTLSLKENATVTLQENYNCAFADPTTMITTCPTDPLDPNAVNITNVLCVAFVTSFRAPTGSVSWTTATPGFAINPFSCTLVPQPNSNSSFCSITFLVTSYNVPIPPRLPLIVSYSGDAYHLSNQTQYDLPISRPPSTVTVFGTAISTHAGTNVTGIEFKNTASGTTYKAIFSVKTGDYTITLSNQQSYEVKIFYGNIVNPVKGSCIETLTLESANIFLVANYQC